METMVFVTYLISIVSLAVSLYVAVELHYSKKENKRKEVRNRLQQITRPVNKNKKGHWD